MAGWERKSPAAGEGAGLRTEGETLTRSATRQDCLLLRGFGFRDGGLAEQVAAAGRRITLLEPYTSRISWADAHPDAAGQAEIAKRIREVGHE